MEASQGNQQEAGVAGTWVGEFSSEKCLILDVLKLEPKGSALDWMWCEGEVSNDCDFLA